MTNNDNRKKEAAFHLLRVISIDSYSPGGEVILKVDGGAILTGENGAGKTSLIRLIPVFFGELPRRISVGTQSFADFYLARTTSYNIFEYERRGVVCQAVIYAGHGDEAYTYRFIRAPYRFELFTEADGKSFIPGNSLSTHLKKMGVDCSRALSHDNYRAIIQGRTHAGREAAANRGYVNDYAFTTPGNRLDHIDRIVSGMFRRKAEFKDFLRMVVSYISDKEDAIAVSGDRGKIAVWPKQYAAYQSVMRLAPRMEDVNRLDAEISVHGQRLSGLHAKLLMLAAHSSQQTELSRRLHDEAQENLGQLKQKHEAESLSLSQKETTARLDAEHHEAHLKAHDAKQEEYTTAGAEQKSHLVSELPALTARQAEAQARRTIVVGEKEKIDQKYEALKLTETGGLNDRTGVALQEKESVRERFDAERAVLAACAEAQMEDLGREHQGRIEAAQELVGQLRDEAVRHEEAVKRPTADPLLVDAWQRKQEAVDKARKAMEAPKRRHDRAVDAQKAARIAYDHQDDLVRGLVRRIDDLGSQIERLQAQANPLPGSLLSFLRKERADWTLDIAKVINEDLLSRDDLAPEIVENAVAAFYGMSLDLSRIDSPLVADESRLLEEIRVVEAQRARVANETKVQEAELKKMGEVLRSATEEVQLALTAVNAAAATTQTAEADERTSRGAMHQSEKESKRKAQEAVDLARGKEREALVKLKDARDAHLVAKKRLSDETSQGIRKIELACNEALLAITNRIADDKRQATEHLKQLDEERHKALSDEGVDVVTLKEIDEEIASLAKSIADAKSWEKLVAEWRAWLADEWPSRGKLAQQASDCRATEAKVQRQLKTKTEAWLQYLSDETRRITQLERSARDSKCAAETCAQRIENHNLSDYPPEREILSQPYDMSWTLDSLTAQLAKCQGDRRGTFARLKTLIDEFKNVFRSGAGTPTEDYFQSTADAVDPNNDNPAGWIEPLREWYDRRHTEYLRSLLVEARKFGELIIGFKRDVEKFSQRIRSFNATMQKALDDTIVFSRISQVSIHFSSTIADKEYWQPINAFITNHEAWVRGLHHDLPPPSFATDLNQLLEHWDIRAGIRAERLSLIDASGSVIENGVEKKFRDSATLGDLSSNGLSYLILIVIFVAFLRMIRGDANVCVTYAVDELGDLDRKNIGILVDMLRRNGIDLVSACPEADLVVLEQFPNRYKVMREGHAPDLVEMDVDDLWELGNV